jgi:hypothetical protein
MGEKNIPQGASDAAKGIALELRTIASGTYGQEDIQNLKDHGNQGGWFGTEKATSVQLKEGYDNLLREAQLSSSKEEAAAKVVEAMGKFLPRATVEAIADDPNCPLSISRALKEYTQVRVTSDAASKSAFELLKLGEKGYTPESFFALPPEKQMSVLQNASIGIPDTQAQEASKAIQAAAGAASAGYKAAAEIAQAKGQTISLSDVQNGLNIGVGRGKISIEEAMREGPDRPVSLLAQYLGNRTGLVPAEAKSITDYFTQMMQAEQSSLTLDSVVAKAKADAISAQNQATLTGYDVQRRSIMQPVILAITRFIRSILVCFFPVSTDADKVTAADDRRAITGADTPDTRHASADTSGSRIIDPAVSTDIRAMQASMTDANAPATGAVAGNNVVFHRVAANDHPRGHASMKASDAKTFSTENGGGAKQVASTQTGLGSRSRGVAAGIGFNPDT